MLVYQLECWWCKRCI